ncbi:MAG: DUF1583 domain-containing protein, partial [Planctomycetota bacterium]
QRIGIDPLNEVEVKHWAEDGQDVALKPNAWNTVELVSETEMVLLRINGKDVCRLEKTPNQKFGILREADREVRVRSVRLSGPWPESLPKDWLAH